MSENKYLKQIKSFVLRQGKITIGQAKAINELMPKYGVGYQVESINLANCFGRDNPKIIEIGFGMGDATWQIAQNSPNNDYLGIEVHSPGVGSLLMSLQEHNLTNVKIIQHDAVEVLKHMISNNSVSGFHIYFPDPWHKKRHHKRRIIQHDFVNLLVQKLLPNGYIHLATDWQDYAIWILEILQQNDGIINCCTTQDYISRPALRPLTKFEQRGINLGHKVWDLMFKKL